MSELIGAYIEITGKCNAKCAYCYNEVAVANCDSITPARLKTLLSEVKSQGLDFATLSGGEPYLYADFHAILAHARDIGLQINIISNGTCFRDAHMKNLVDFQPSLQISFDGYDEMSHDATRGTGNFKLITEGIKTARLLGYTGAVNARINLHKNNIGNVSDILNMLSALFKIDGNELRDINGISIALLHKTSNAGSAFTAYLEKDEYKKYPEIFTIFDSWNASGKSEIQYDFANPDLGCPYNDTFENLKCGFRFAPDGNVFPCQGFTDNRFSVGCIYDNTLSEILQGEKLLHFLNTIQSRRDKISKCKSCGYSQLCGRGCPAQAFIDNNTVLSVSDQCSARKESLSQTVAQAFSTKSL